MRKMRRITKIALRYLDKGFSFYPVETESKLPLVVGYTSSGKAIRVKWGKYRDRKPARAEVFLWFETLKADNIALITGIPSRLAVVDCDDKESIAAFAKECIKCGIDIKQLLRVPTKRGMHYYFMIPEDLDSLKSSQNLIDGFKVELKADGACIKAPPSYFSDFSGRYEFVKGDFIELPKWIIDKVKEKNKKVYKVSRFRKFSGFRDRKVVQSIAVFDKILDDALSQAYDSRNRACFIMCLRLLRNGISEGELRDYIYRFLSMCPEKDHKFTEQEAFRCLESAKRYV